MIRSNLRSYRGRWPQIAASAYIDPAAVVIGDVTIGEQASVWPGAVIRGDVHWIRIGARSNVQDGSILHVMKDQFPLIIEEGVTVGHGVILHGCTIESRVLVGMGSILLNNVRVGTGSIIAAGTLLAEGTKIAPGSLFMGHPGKLRRTLTPQELEGIDAYVGMSSMRRLTAMRLPLRSKAPLSLLEIEPRNREIPGH